MYPTLKRIIDIVLSFIGLIVLSPLFLIIIILIKLDSKGPVLFRQRRFGKNKVLFDILKFRTMRIDTPKDTPTHLLENPEQWITKVGKILRKTSLDELPQIINILKGEMSIIGPRPALWNQYDLIDEREKYNANNIPVGLTGWAQINGRDELSIDEKAKLDGEYTQKMGIAMDAKVFLKSLGVFGGDDSVVEGGTSEMKSQTIERSYANGKTVEELIGHIGFGEAVEVDTETEKKVLITGAGSYIGETFRLYAREHYSALKVDAVNMLDSAWKEIDFSEYDIVYHVAGLAHSDVGNVDDATKAKYYAVNTDLAVEVCEKAKTDGVKEFIFMSSMIVYGDSAPYGKSKVVDEHTIPVAANFYGDSKLQADVAVREMADDIFKVIVLRPPMIYGKGSKGNYSILAKIAKKIALFPNVENERSMLYIDNLCELLCQIMLMKEVKENAIVLVPQNAEWTKTSEMVKEIAEVSGKKIVLMGGIMKLAVLFGGKASGKIGELVNKVFGNSTYTHDMSIYKGIDYQMITLKESIMRTEGRESNVDSNKYNNLKIGSDLLVSVVMPAYNAEAFILDSIYSVINQIYKNWELNVVDDGSNDNTVNIVKELTEIDDRIHLYCQEKNAGSAAARNRGITESNGRYIAFLDSDDLWSCDKLEKQIGFMKKNDYGFTFTSYELFSSETGESRGIFKVPESINYDAYLKNTIIGNLTVILDRWKIDDVHVEIGYLEDVLTWMHFLKKGYIAYGLNDNLARYRVYSSSKSGNKIKNAKRYYECLRKNQKLSLAKSMYCEFFYLINALLKRIKGKLK